MSKEILRDPGHSEDNCPRVAIRMGCCACGYPDSEAIYPAPDFPILPRQVIDQEAILENERLSFLDKLPKGMSLEDYKEINEVIRKNDGFSKEEFYPVDNIPYYGIEPDKMVFTHFFPDSPGWFGDICIIFWCYHNMFTYLVKDGTTSKLFSKKGWRIFKEFEVNDGEY